MLRKTVLLAGVAGVSIMAAVSAQAASPYDVGMHRALATGVSNFVEPKARNEAVALITGNEFSVASPYPTGHFHSDDTDSFGTGTDWMEVGYFPGEDVRGMAEFDISGGAFTVDSASVGFQVAQLGGLFGQLGPGDFTIEVYVYAGNNAEDLDDYDIAATLVGSFGTSGLAVAQYLDFDVTAEFNTAVGNADPSFGVRLQASTDPGEAAVVFGDATLTMATNPPLPPPMAPVPATTPTGLLALLLVMLTAGLVVLRSRAGS